MKTKLVGILNYTPDSFSDGGNYPDVSAAIAAIEQMITDGADVIDIGAESTRPGATPLTAEQEIERLAPLIKSLKSYSFPVPLSLDTRHAQSAKLALDDGFSWINDVSGFSNEAMQDTVAGYHCMLVIMHALSIPADKNKVLPEGCDVIKELIAFAKKQTELLVNTGIKRERIIFDPGIGFGKTAAQSWDIIQRVPELKALGLPLYIGHSRKSFLNAGSMEERDAKTLAVSKTLALAGVDYLRVHHIALHSQNL